MFLLSLFSSCFICFEINLKHHFETGSHIFSDRFNNTLQCGLEKNEGQWFPQALMCPCSGLCPLLFYLESRVVFSGQLHGSLILCWITVCSKTEASDSSCRQLIHTHMYTAHHTQSEKWSLKCARLCQKHNGIFPGLCPILPQVF